MAQNPVDRMTQASRMAAEQYADAPQATPMAVNPHDSLTAPISPAPVQMATNELGDPMGRTNELGDALPEPEASPQMSAAAPSSGRMSFSPQKERLSSKLAADYKKDTDPYGSPDNHPGFGGKLLHSLSMAGNIAGDIVSPTLMSRIPGSDLHRQIEEKDIEGRLQNISKEESAEGLQGAQTAEAGARTKGMEGENENMPQKFADMHAQSGALTEHEKATTNALENPPEEWKSVPGIIGPNGEPVEIEGKSGQVRFGGVSGTQQQKPPKPDTPEQQYLDEYAKLHPGSTVGQAERQYSLDTQRPPQITPTMMMMPGPNGYTATAISPGQTVGPGAVTAAGMNSMNVPSAATRTMAETSPKVIDLANRAEQLIDQQINTLGPAGSRWSEFMAGKVGAPNPEFTKLRTNIGLLQTALMRMHVGARGGEQIMEHFRDLIDSSKQDPQNLKAALDEIKAYAVEVGRSGGTGAAAETDKAMSSGTNAPMVQHSPSTGQDRFSTDGGKTWQAGKPKQ